MAKTKEFVMYGQGVYESISLSTSYNTTFGNYIGYEPGAITKTYVMGYKPSYTLLENISDTATVTGMTLSLTVGNSKGTQKAYVGTVSSPLDFWDNKFTFEKIMEAPAIWTLETGTTNTLKITDAETIEKILTYGIGIRPDKTGDWAASVNMTASYEYVDPYEPPEIFSISVPPSAYINDSIDLSWAYSQVSNIEQYAVDVEVTDAAGKTHTLLHKHTTTKHSCTVNFHSLEVSTGDAVFRVRAYIQSGTVVGEWASSQTVTLKNVQLAIVHPKGGENKLAAEPMRMQWKKADSDTSENDPYAFTVQYSENAGESWEQILNKSVASKENNVWYVDIPADKFRHGIVQWRVMPWTTQYVSGDYVKDSFFAVVQASTESVSCDGKPTPTVSWASESQIAYQVRFADYDSGAVYGKNTSHRVPYIYADGLYSVQVRTQATTGVWSEWTEEQYVTIENVSPVGSVVLSVDPLKHSVAVKWSVYGTFRGYILYRNGIPIYTGTDLAYNDVGANGDAEYFIRAITADLYYVQSEKAIVNAKPQTDCIYDYTGGKWIQLKYSVGKRTREYTTSQKVTYKHYAGRKKPVVFTEQFTERVGEFEYAFRTTKEAEQVISLVGCAVLYKGKDGSVIYGIINNITNTSASMRSITFTINEIDSVEKVPYEIA